MQPTLPALLLLQALGLALNRGPLARTDLTPSQFLAVYALPIIPQESAGEPSGWAVICCAGAPPNSAAVLSRAAVLDCARGLSQGLLVQT